MFAEKAGARADLRAGVLYSICGEGDWIYYGQVSAERRIGFFRRRDRELADPGSVLLAPLMSVVTVSTPSLTQALRSGRWIKLGTFPPVEALRAPRPSVQWPVGTLIVTVWIDGRPDHVTHVADPAIQDWEQMAVWSAEHHISARLTADFGAEERAWNVGGSIRRARLNREERAKRYPDAPHHALPPDWVFAGAV